jgi:hypothetical protein
LASPSEDGGFEEFREFEFTCASNSATRTRSVANSRCNSPTSTTNSALDGELMNEFSQHQTPTRSRHDVIANTDSLYLQRSTEGPDQLLHRYLQGHNTHFLEDVHDC